MKIFWNSEKAKSNYKKHGIHFSDTELVLNDPMALTIEDNAENEQRFVSIGIDSINRILVIVFAYQDEDIRIISARRATKKEKKDYENRICFQQSKTRRNNSS